VPAALSLASRAPRPAAWALVLLVSWSCVAAPPRRSEIVAPEVRELVPRPAASLALSGTTAASASAVVLVVLDGVRWQELFEGVDPEIARRQKMPEREWVDAESLMPTLHDVLIARGVAVGAPGQGPEMRASGPNYVSLPGYNEILSGRPPSHCPDNGCAATRETTLPDELALGTAIDPRGEVDAAVISSWESIDRAASRGGTDVVVSAGRHHGRSLDVLRTDDTERRLLDQASRSSSWPGEADFRPDRYTIDIALRLLETRAPRFLFIGLGEPDEFAHQDNYRGYLDSLRAADRALARLVGTLGRLGERGRRTSIFVTTDHGRSNAFRDHGGFAPESGRVWLVASGAGIEEKGLVRSEVPHRLADIAPTMRVLLGMNADPRRDAGRAIEEILWL
jgi:hypothetical protein